MTAGHSELLDQVRAIVWRADAPSFRTIYASKQAEDILGFPTDRWVKDPDFWKKQIHRDDVAWVLDFSRREVERKRNHSFEYRMLAADGRVVWLRNIVNVIVKDGRPKWLAGLSVDITERKLAEQARNDLAARLMRAQEEERSSIARELHDDVGQNLALLNIGLHQLERSLRGTASKQRVALGVARRLAVKIAGDVQRISHGLHSSQLEQLGLAGAVRDMCTDFAKNSGTDVECKLGEIPRDLDGGVAACLTRVLQECLRNTLKHSKASRVRVNLSTDAGTVRLVVWDDGVGFQPAAASKSPGLGLVSMAERLRLVRGELQVTSAPAKGTRIVATVRLPARSS